MSNQSDYNEKLETISNIPDEQIIKPNMPIYVANQEAENLSQHAARDRDVLLKAGLPPGLIEDLAKRAGACRHAEALWIQKRFLHSKAQKEWKEKLKGYRSNYHRHKSARRKKDEDEDGGEQRMESSIPRP